MYTSPIIGQIISWLLLTTVVVYYWLNGDINILIVPFIWAAFHLYYFVSPNMTTVEKALKYFYLAGFALFYSWLVAIGTAVLTERITGKVDDGNLGLLILLPPASVALVIAGILKFVHITIYDKQISVQVETVEQRPVVDKNSVYKILLIIFVLILIGLILNYYTFVL
jgi:hypothetical protein